MDPVLIFFAALAGFLIYQLYTKLGSTDDSEPAHRDRFEREEPPEPVMRREEQVREPLPDWAQPIAVDYPAFDPKTFLDGAEAAYEMIVSAFAAGKLKDVKTFIDPSVFRAFSTAVDAREASSQTSELQFVGIEKSTVTGHVTEQGFLKVTVTFLSNQIRVLRDKDGNVLDGDPNRIDLVKDVWTFARPLRSSDPNWVLVATGGNAPAAG